MSTTSFLDQSPCSIEHALSPWQGAISQGNLAFETGDMTLARDHYTIAHQLAANLLNQFANAVITESVLAALSHCCPAVVVAAHNLADTYKVMGKPKQACLWLCRVHDSLSQLLIHNDRRVVTLVAHHHQKTYYELVKFAQLYTHQPELIDSINTALKDSPSLSKYLH